MQHSSKRNFFGMSVDFFQRLTTLKGTYICQMSCTRELFCRNWPQKSFLVKSKRGIEKSFILKDPVKGVLGSKNLFSESWREGEGPLIVLKLLEFHYEMHSFQYLAQNIYSLIRYPLLIFDNALQLLKTIVIIIWTPCQHTIAAAV